MRYSMLLLLVFFWWLFFGLSLEHVQAAPSFTLQSAFPDGASDLLNEPRSVKVSGDYAYVLSRIDASITIFDISDPANPSKVGQIQDATNLTSKRFLEVSGDYVYAGGTTSTSIAVYNVTNKTSPSLVDVLNISALYYDLDIQGTYLYAYGASSTSCFTVVDISDPTNIQEVINVADASHCNGGLGGTVSGSYLYTYSSSGTNEFLTVFDISTPSSPALRGYWGAIANGYSSGLNDPNCQDLEYKSGYVYCIAWRNSEIIAIDVSDPTNPFTADTIVNTTAFNTGIYADFIGDYLIVGGYNSKTLAAIDVSSPTNMQLVTYINDTTNLNNPYDLDASGIYIYVPSLSSDILSIWSFDGLGGSATQVTQNLGDTSVQITWTSSEPTSTQIAYGVSDALGSLTVETDVAQRVSYHTVTLTGLQDCTTYYYQIRGSDTSGNTVVVQPGYFKTGCPVANGVEPPPDYQEYAGGFVRKGAAEVMVESNTFPYDVNFDVTATKNDTPIHFGDWWQISDVYEIWFRSHFNGARVIDAKKPSILVLHYEPSWLRNSGQSVLLESSIRIAYSSDGVSWRVMPKSILNPNQKNGAALTTVGGYYMLVSRWNLFDSIIKIMY